MYDPFKAWADAGLVEKVARFFDNNPQTTIYELIQNSRRSGASRVDINVTKLSTGEHVVKLKDDKVKELSFYYNTLPNKPIEAFKGLYVYLLKSTIISTLGDDYKTEKLNKDTFSHEALTWKFRDNIKMTLVFSEGGYCYYLILTVE